jgi:hypothetical protein
MELLLQLADAAPLLDAARTYILDTGFLLTRELTPLAHDLGTFEPIPFIIPQPSSWQQHEIVLTSECNIAFTDQTRAVATQSIPSPAPALPFPAVNALDFLRSRPQVAAMNQIRNFLPQQRAATPAPALPSKAAKTKTPDTDSLVYKKDHGDVEVLPRSLHAQAPGSNMRRFPGSFVGCPLQTAARAPPSKVAKHRSQTVDLLN